MLGDILLIQEKHKKAGEVIIERILKDKKEKYIVAISGESGSGKTELTHVIAKGLRKYGIFAKPLHTDNYYNTLPPVRWATLAQEHKMVQLLKPLADLLITKNYEVVDMKK